MASKNVETLRAAHESWNRRDFAGVVRNSAESLVYTDNARSLSMNGPDKFREWTEATAFSTGATVARCNVRGPRRGSEVVLKSVFAEVQTSQASKNSETLLQARLRRCSRNTRSRSRSLIAFRGALVNELYGWLFAIAAFPAINSNPFAWALFSSVCSRARAAAGFLACISIWPSMRSASSCNRNRPKLCACVSAC